MDIGWEDGESRDAQQELIQRVFTSEKLLYGGQRMHFIADAVWGEKSIVTQVAQLVPIQHLYGHLKAFFSERFNIVPCSLSHCVSALARLSVTETAKYPIQELRWPAEKVSLMLRLSVVATCWMNR